MDFEDAIPQTAAAPVVQAATVAAPAPATVTAPLYVVVPGEDGGRVKTGPCQWQPIPGSLPAVGDRCVLVQAADADRLAPWVAVFDGRDVPIPAASGPAGGDLAGTYPNPTLGGTYKAALPFAAGWSSAPGNEAATYSKVGRLVTLQGVVTKSTTPSAFDTIGTLPVGFRPTGQLIFAVATGGTPTAGVVFVTPAGAVTWWAGNTTATNFTSLSGISFVI